MVTWYSAALPFSWVFVYFSYSIPFIKPFSEVETLHKSPGIAAEYHVTIAPTQPGVEMFLLEIECLNEKASLSKYPSLGSQCQEVLRSTSRGVAEPILECSIRSSSYTIRLLTPKWRPEEGQTESG